MPRAPTELALERARLLERIEYQRAQVAERAAPLLQVESLARQAWSQGATLSTAAARHPALLAVAAALLVLWRPRTAWRWSRRALWVWQRWRGLRGAAARWWG